MCSDLIMKSSFHGRCGNSTVYEDGIVFADGQVKLYRWRLRVQRKDGYEKLPQRTLVGDKAVTQGSPQENIAVAG